MIALIRHGKTRGNTEGRYVGRTDEELCEEGARELTLISYPRVDRVFVSPMKRCLQTAGIIYPGLKPIIVGDFRETDFGAFEYKTYRELFNDQSYVRWIASEGEDAPPETERRSEFNLRCARAFLSISGELPRGDSAIIVHGGTIMAIMAIFARPKMDYYAYQVKNGRGFSADIAPGENGRSVYLSKRNII